MGSEPAKNDNGETLGCGLVLFGFFLLYVLSQGFDVLKHLIDAGWRPS